MVKVIGCRVQVISRGKGRSAVAAAAYRSGEKIINQWDGNPHDYTRKQGIIYTEIFTPLNAPSWMHDRPLLWNSIELFDKPKNAQLAREFQIDLPLQLSLEQNIKLAKEYAQQLVKEGMVVDLCIHAPDKKNPNPHAHIMTTMRPLNPDGTWGEKCRKEYVLDKKGEKIKLPSGEWKSKRVNTMDWDNRNKVEIWREQYAHLVNQYLEHYQHPDRVTHQSYERQGLDQVATVRLSHIDYEKEQRGIQTERGNINRAIKAENQYREKASQMLELIDKAIHQEEARLQEERKKVAGQGKEMKGEPANRHHHELEQPQRRPPELSYRERYLQRAEQHKLVRDQERSRSYRKPQQQTLDRYKKKSSLHDLFKEEIQKHHERQADERPIDKEQNQDPDRER